MTISWLILSKLNLALGVTPKWQFWCAHAFGTVVAKGSRPEREARG